MFRKPGIKPISRLTLLLAALLSVELSPQNRSETEWIEAERKQARGILHNLSAAIEKPTGGQQLRDSADRRFIMNAQGRLKFDINETTWWPTLPDARHSVLLYSESQSLKKRGARLEALFILKALRAMGRNSNEQMELKHPSQKATSEINRVQQSWRNYKELDRQSDPFAYYNHAGNTAISSDLSGLALELPGHWQVAYRTDTSETKFTSDFNQAWFKKENLILKVLIEPRPIFISKHDSVINYMRYRDQLRTLNRAQQDLLNYTRTTHSMHNSFCLVKTCALMESRMSYRLAFNNEPYISRFETGEDPPKAPRERKLNFLEYYLLQDDFGYYLELQFEPDEQSEAKEVMNTALKSLR